ncbi:MAG: OadG family protein [Rikenellaceae bacterium]
MENLNTALTLMAVGMGTVFIILLCIINFSKLLIMAVNRYAPEEVKEVKKSRNAAANQSTTKTSPKLVAAISTAVNIATDGKMQVQKIEKI